MMFNISAHVDTAGNTASQILLHPCFFRASSVLLI